MRALWLPDVLADAGLEVIEQAGWQDRGKELVSLEGVVCHHTASPSTSTLTVNLAVVVNGNTVAPGPIANLLLWRDGTYYVIASGRANHAGAGGPWRWLPDGQANLRTLGIEAVNDGLGELWSNEMLDAYEIGVAAILEHIGVDETHVLTHNEWAPTRKIDPAGPTSGRVATLPGRQTWSGDAWRERIAARLAPTPIPAPPPEEDDMEKPRLIRPKGYANEFLYSPSAGAFTHGGDADKEPTKTWRRDYGTPDGKAEVWEHELPIMAQGIFAKAGLDISVDGVPIAE